MPTSYTSLLGLALPVTGELAGTWGDTVNDYISKYVDSSVAGTQTISGSQTAVTLTRANGAALSQAGSGATGSSQYQVINCTGNPAGTLTVTIDVTTGSPTLSNSTYSQTFAVINGTSTSQSVVVRATTTSGTSTGTTLVSGEKALIAWNGSDFIKVATSTVDGVSTIAFGTTGLTPSSATSGAVTVAGTLVAANGGTGQSSYTTGDLLYATGSTALSKLGIGTNGQILTSTGTAPQWSTLSGVAVTTFSAGTTGFTPSVATSGAITLAGTLATTNGGTGLTSFTANGVVYASSTSALTTGSALTFDGTNFATTGSGTFSGILSRIHAQGTDAYITNTTTGKANTVMGFNDSGSTTAQGIPTGYAYYGTLQSYPIGFTSGGYLTNSISSTAHIWNTTGSEQMRLTSTGLGIGTSSPNAAGWDKAVTINGSTSSALEIQVGGSRKGEFAALSGGVYLQTVGAIPIIFSTNSAEKMRLDSSGNLGLGVTPSAWFSVYKPMQLGSYGAAIAGQTNSQSLSLWNNAYPNASNVDTYTTTNAANKFRMDGGAFQFFTAPSGTAGNAISFTQAMTLDASGNLLVGTTSSIYNSAGRGVIELNGSSDNIFAMKVAGAQNFYVQSNATNTAVWNVANTYMSFGTNNTERARITSSGEFLVNTTSSIYSAAGRGVIELGGGSTAIFAMKINNSAASYLYHDGTVFSVNNVLNGALAFATNNTERARITSDGVFLVGSSTSDLTSTTKSIVVGNFGVQYGGSTGTFLQVVPGAANGTVDMKFDARTGAYPAATFWTNNTERARITSGGNLLVGTTTDPAYSGYTTLALNSGTNGGLLDIQLGGSRIGSLQAGSSTELRLYAAASVATTLYGGGTERARITSGGDLLVGTTTASDYRMRVDAATNNHAAVFVGPTAGYASVQVVNTAGSGTRGLISFRTLVGGSEIGAITTDGTNTTYSTSSDYRLKNTIAPMTGALAKVAALKPVTYKWNADGSDGEGFIAHELAEVAPQCVTGEKDAVDAEGNPVYQGIDTSFLVATLTAAIQEQQATITDLRARVAQLEAK